MHLHFHDIHLSALHLQVVNILNRVITQPFFLQRKYSTYENEYTSVKYLRSLDIFKNISSVKFC